MNENLNRILYSLPIFALISIYIISYWLKLFWTIVTVDSANQGNIWLDGEVIPFSSVSFVTKTLFGINLLLLSSLWCCPCTMLDWLYNWYRTSRIRKKDFLDCAITALKLHVSGEGVSGYYIRDTLSQELVFRLQGGSTLLTNNGKEWFFVREGTIRLNYVTENMKIRVIEELDVKPKDQFWNIGRVLFYDKKHCDVKIVLRNGETLPAHQCILKTALPGLKGLSDRNPKGLHTVHLKNEATEYAREFIKAVYTRDVPKDPNLLVNVGRLAGKYQDWPLLQKCCKELAVVLRLYPEYHQDAKKFIERFPMVQSSLREAFLQAFEKCAKNKINLRVGNYVGNIGAKQLASPVHYYKTKQFATPNHNSKEDLLSPRNSSFRKIKRDTPLKTYLE